MKAPEADADLHPPVSEMSDRDLLLAIHKQVTNLSLEVKQFPAKLQQVAGAAQAAQGAAETACGRVQEMRGEMNMGLGMLDEKIEAYCQPLDAKVVHALELLENLNQLHTGTRHATDSALDIGQAHHDRLVRIEEHLGLDTPSASGAASAG